MNTKRERPWNDLSARYQCLDSVFESGRLAGESPVSGASAADIAFCSMVKAELFYGAYHSSRREDNLRLLATLFPQFKSVPFDDMAAETYGRLCADLAAQGTPIGPNDLMIAAIALAKKLTLVTHNTREFTRVAGLRLEDWALS